MHDQLIYRIDRRTADRLFRVALRETEVSWLRRWLMWAAVRLTSLAKEGSKLTLLIVNLVAFFGAVGLWWFGGVSPWWIAVIGGAGLLWGRLWPLLIIGIAILLPATLIVWITIFFVGLIDSVAWAFGSLANRSPPPPSVVPYRNQRLF
jgi:hypothetical protein